MGKGFINESGSLSLKKKGFIFSNSSWSWSGKVPEDAHVQQLLFWYLNGKLIWLSPGCTRVGNSDAADKSDAVDTVIVGMKQTTGGYLRCN